MQYLDTITYNVKVKTGDMRNAGTDAKVHLKIFGDKGDTGNRELKRSENTSNMFERGRIDNFKIEADDIGRVINAIFSHSFSFLALNLFITVSRLKKFESAIMEKE